RPRRSAAVFMGDSGSQVLGFVLACLALLTSWKVAGTSLTTILLPLLVLAIPILDTALVTVTRLLEGRPVSQGGRDHSSHRLVYYGLSERKAVGLLAGVAATVGATGIAYNVLNNPRVTVLGVLLTFVLLVQFASALADLEEQSRRGESPGDVPLRALFFQPRRLVEIVVDSAIICVSFLVAYLLHVGGLGDAAQRGSFLAALPLLLGARYVAYVAAGVYRRVWRFAGTRDAVALAAATIASELGALLLLWAWRGFQGLPPAVFFVDALFCLFLVGASRLLLRVARRRASTAARRVLVVGAGRAGRGIARELGEATDVRVIGYLDDNPQVRRRRVGVATVIGALDNADAILDSRRVDEVIVTIPDAPEDRLNHVLEACAAAGVPCRIARRELAPPPVTPARAEVSRQL
ncbi:MAG TPA: hypothetical protein VNT58_03875, partial [Gaiellaceae bacterium]|nr:hypothetical protein [Gaiellaceae bacterium]